MADAYRKIADDEDMSPEDRELVLQKIRVYDHMSLLEKKDIEIGKRIPKILHSQ